MKFIRKFDRYITAIFFFTIITVVATSYFTFKESFADHSQRQQEALIPLFSLVTTEIIRPLTVSQYMATDDFLISYIQQDKIETKKLADYLKSVSAQFNMLTFIALEKHDLMIDSLNKKMSLNNQKMEWFQRLKKLDRKQLADIGNADNPHLYFDIKILDKNSNFLGFAGVGVDLDAFENVFSEYKKRFGFELFFVDENDYVTLSTSNIMKTESHHRTNEVVNINSLPWYQKYSKEYNATNEVSYKENIFSTMNINGLIISQIPLKGLNWRIFLIAPPADKQSEYWTLFLGKLVVFILVSFILFYIFSIAINYFKSSLVKDSETDYLTQLPNRSYVHWRYEALAQKYEHACVVIADIDNFKIINDSYGHLVGDDVLKVIAKNLSENLRQIDLIGRWGGEEFIMILPETSNEQAEEVINRIRIEIAKIPFKCSTVKDKFNITVSFGISSSKLKNTHLDSIIKKADIALYKAKESGRNKVVIHVE